MARFPRRPLTRRGFLALGASTLAGAYLVACDGGDGGGSDPTATSAGSTGTLAPPTGTPVPDALTWRLVDAGDPWPTPRRDHSLVSDGERLYLFAGRNPDPLGDLWTYDLATGVWAEIAAQEGPPPRFGHNAVWDAQQGRMLVFGGQSFATFFNDLWAYAPDTGWVELGTDGAPAARYGSGGAIDGQGRLIVTHGFTSGGRFDDTWQYAAAWSDLSPASGRPVERCLMRATWDGSRERLLMFGGQTTSEPFLGDTWVFDGTAWREIDGPAPSPRTFYAMVDDPARARAVLFGGNTADGPTNDLWAFDHATDTWAEQAVEGDAPTPRSGQDAVVAGDTMLVFGGRNPEGDSADLWELRLVP